MAFLIIFTNEENHLITIFYNDGHSETTYPCTVKEPLPTD
jgi:hypothetical protein